MALIPIPQVRSRPPVPGGAGAPRHSAVKMSSALSASSTRETADQTQHPNCFLREARRDESAAAQCGENIFSVIRVIDPGDGGTNAMPELFPPAGPGDGECECRSSLQRSRRGRRSPSPAGEYSFFRRPSDKCGVPELPGHKCWNASFGGSRRCPGAPCAGKRKQQEKSNQKKGNCYD